MINVTPHIPHGQQMPGDWKAHSAARKAAAEAAYLNKLQNAWKSPLNKSNDSDIFNARLTSDSAGLSCESRTDSLRMVVDNEEERVWIGNGVTIRKKNNQSKK